MGRDARLLRAPGPTIIAHMCKVPLGWLLVMQIFSACSVADGVTKQVPVRSKPNIVFIMADDMGYGDVHAMNPASQIPTPNLDELSAQGMTFTDAHTPSAVCTPTRYGVVTGRYCWRGRLKRGVINGYGKPVIEEGRETVASFLAGQGYKTHIVGKWHLGLEWPRKPDGKANDIDFARPVEGGPNAYGFAHSYIIPASLDFPPYVYIENGRVTDSAVVQQSAQRFPAFLRKGPRAKDLVMEDVLDHLADHAAGLIKASSRSPAPFFLYLPLPAPHKPVLPHPAYRGKTGLNDYADFVAQVDGAVGRVLRALDDAGCADNTLVVYTSDNGSFMFRLDDDAKADHVEDATVQGYRPEHHRANGALRGTKADIWEAGHRVPFFVRWPGVVKADQRSDATVCLTDFFATCADVVQVGLAEDCAEDSVSFLPQLTGLVPATERPPVIHHSGSGMFAIRAGKWKLVAGNGSGGRQKPRGKPFAAPFQLFDLEADLGEAHDLAEKYPQVVKQLTRELQELREAGRSRSN